MLLFNLLSSSTNATLADGVFLLDQVTVDMMPNLAPKTEGDIHSSVPAKAASGE